MPKLTGADIYQGFRARGFGPAQAAALAGNAQQESNFNPAAWNAGSGAGGLMQWRNDRLSGLLDYAKATGRDPNDAEAQMDYVAAEMKGPESKAAQAINAATDITSANAAVKKYLRYGPTEAGNRLQYSQAFADAPPAATGNAPAAPDVGTQLNAIFGSGAAPQQAPSGTDTGQALDAIFGPTVNPFGTTAKPGTPEYAAAAMAWVKSGQPLPAADPAHHPSVAAIPDNVPAPLRAFSNGAVESVPVLGPAIHGLRDAVIPALGGQSAGAMDASDQAAAAAAPAAAMAGNVFGTVAPFLAVGPETLAGKALGMAGDYGGGVVGNALARTVAGGLSGAAISGADTAARGGNINQVGQNMLTAGVVGGIAAPAAHAVGSLIGKGANAFFGKSAPQAIADAMHEDQQAPAQVNQLIQNLGPSGTAADLGPNTESLAGGLASLPGKPKAIVINNLLARSAGAGDRLNADIATNLGTGSPVGALVDQVTAQQKAAATPLYDAVRPQPVTMTPELQAIQATPLGRQAFQTAATMMANDGKSGTGITVGFLDAAKQALDDVASSAARAGNNNAARQASAMAAALRGEVDAQVPAYAAARDAFAGPARVKDAIEQGQAAFSKGTTLEDMQRALAGLSTSERDGFLAGAQDAVQNMIRNARNDAQGVKTAFQSSNAKDKLAALIGPGKAQAISDALDREAKYTSTIGNAVHNSKSAARLAQQRVIDPDLAAVSNKLAARPTLLGLVSDAFGAVHKLATASYRSAQNARLANLLTGGPLSAADAAAVAKAGGRRGTMLPGVGAAMVAKNNGIGIPGGNPLLQWAQPSNMLLPPGAGGPNGPLRIVVRGASPVAQ